MWAICVLGLAALVGVSCGDRLATGIERSSTASTASAANTATANTATGDDYYFAPIKPVLLSDRGPRCATVWVGGVVVLQACDHVSHGPQVMYDEAESGLFVLLVDSGDVVSFPDHSVRVFTTSEHYVVGQMSAGMQDLDLRFTLTSATGVRFCGVNRITTYCR